MYIKLREKEKERDRDRERKENNFYLSCGCIIFKCNILWQFNKKKKIKIKIINKYFNIN